jgi:uncharacterized protein
VVAQVTANKTISINNMMYNNEGESCRVIGKLSIVLTEHCNLSCRYCYAKLSNRWGNGNVMSLGVADMIIEKIVSRAGCEVIQFFGGEPTLNIEVVDYISTRIEKLYDSNTIKKKPRFGIVTNGCFEDCVKVYDVLKKHNIETTVSLDGPPEINDILRIKFNAGLVSQKVIQTISDLKTIGVDVSIETVYTGYHIKNKYSIVDCIKYVKNNLGIYRLVFQPAYPPANNNLNPLSDKYIDTYIKYCVEAVDWWFGELLNNGDVFDIYYKDLLKIMLDDSPALSTGCPAGVTSYSVGPEGNIYPCQLLYGKSDLLISNIADDEFILLSKQMPKIHSDFDECNKCFARHWCQPCAALNLASSGRRMCCAKSSDS